MSNQDDFLVFSEEDFGSGRDNYSVVTFVDDINILNRRDIGSSL